MKKLLIILAIIGFYSVSYAETGVVNYDKNEIFVLKENIKTLENKIDDLNLKLNDKIADNYKSTTDSANMIISNGLSSQGNLLTIFTLAFALFSIYLTWKTNKILSEIEEKNKEIEINKKIIEKLKNEIDNFPRLIYERIKEEETKDMFGRLKIYPEDIYNLFSKLATRKLDGKYYEELKKVYLVNSYQSIRNSALILIFQHYILKLFLDDDLWKDFLNSSVGFGNAYLREKKDIVTSITDFYLENDIEVYKNKYLEFLNKIKKQGCIDELKEHIKVIFEKKDKIELFTELFGEIEKEKTKT